MTKLTAEQAKMLGKTNVTPMTKSAPKRNDAQLLEAGDLSKYFGIEFSENTGAKAIADYAARNPLVMEHDVEGGALRFGGEDFMCIVHHDTDENLEVVFRGIVRTYCPERDVFDTGYRNTIDQVMEQLRVGLSNTFSRKPTKSK